MSRIMRLLQNKSIHSGLSLVGLKGVDRHVGRAGGGEMSAIKAGWTETPEGKQDGDWAPLRITDGKKERRGRRPLQMWHSIENGKREESGNVKEDVMVG